MSEDTQLVPVAPELQGFSYLDRLQPLLVRIHECGVDNKGNRQVFFDQYVSLLLLSFFNPILTSLNALQQATRLFRWSVELFFRWIKRIIGLRHLLCESQRGVTIQVYVAFIASLPIGARIGHKPTRRTYEMVCLFFQG